MRRTHISHPAAVNEHCLLLSQVADVRNTLLQVDGITDDHYITSTHIQHHFPHSSFLSACLSAFSLACSSFYSFSQVVKYCTSLFRFPALFFGATRLNVVASKIWNSSPPFSFSNVHLHGYLSLSSPDPLFPTRIPIP